MRPTRRLVVLCCGLGLSVLAAAQNAWLLGMSCGLLLLIVSLCALDAKLTLAEQLPVLERELPRRARLGHALSVRYRLHNPNRRSVRLSWLDPLPADLGGDRLHGPVALTGQHGAVFEHELLPQRRGLRPLSALHARVGSVLGLFERRFSTADADSALGVLPSAHGAQDSPHGEAPEAGMRPERRRGEGMELDSLRAYASGDDPRHIDWRASARSQRMIVRSFREERNQALMVAVDTGRLMATRSAGLRKLDHALNTAAALAEAALHEGDRVGFAAFDAALRQWLGALDPRRGLGALLEATLPLEPSPLDSSFKVLADTFEARHRKRSLLVVLSDFVESADALELEGYLVRLARRHVVLLVALRDPALEELAQPQPELGRHDLYRRLVLQDLADERDLILRRLTRMGVHTLDLRPEHASGPVLARYLSLRRAL